MFSKAIELLLKTRKCPAMWASNKEAYISRVTSILEMLFDTNKFDSQIFYIKHLEGKGGRYQSSDHPVDECWGQQVVDDALKIINEHQQIT